MASSTAPAPASRGHLHGSSEGATGGDTAENALLTCQLTRSLDRLDIGHGDDAIGHIAIEHGRHEIRSPALDLVRGEGLAREERSAFGFGCDDTHIRSRQADHFAGAGQRAAGAPACHEEVQSPADEIRKDLRARGAAMVGRVRRVLELARQEPAILLREFRGLLHHARAALGGRREDHLGAQHAHDLAAFDREGLDHHRHEGVALGGAHHGECNAGISRGRLDHGLPGLELAAPLGILDDADRQAILDRGERVEELALDVHRRARGGQAIDAHDGRAADGPENAVVNHAGTVIPPFRPSDK